MLRIAVAPADRTIAGRGVTDGRVRWSVSLLSLLACGALHSAAGAEPAAPQESSQQQIRPIDVSSRRPQPARVRPQPQPRRQQVRRTLPPPPPSAPPAQVATESGRSIGTGAPPPRQAASEMTFTGEEI